MTLERPMPPQGRIELLTGRSVKEVPAKMQKEEKTIIPENEEICLRAMRCDPLIPFDESMRVDGGHILIQTLRSPRKDQVPMLVEMGLDPMKTLIERWGEYQTIDTAFRGTNHMREQYDQETGIRIEHLREAIRQSNIMAHELQKPGLSLERLEEIRSQMARASAKTKLSTAYNVHYLDIAKQLDRALTPDSLNRPNTARSRLMRGYVQPKFARALFVGRRTDVKNGNRNSLLYQERDFEQLGLKSLVRDCNTMKELSDFEFRIAIDRFLNNASYLLSTDFIKVQPYVDTAAICRFMLSDAGEEAQEDLEKNANAQTNEQVLAMCLPPFNRLEPALQKKVLSSVAGIITKSIQKSDKRMATSWLDSLFEDPDES